MTEAEGDTLIAPGQRSGAWALPERLGLTEEIELLRRFFAEWLESCDPELAPMLSYQLSSRSKLFRPVTVFACHRALSDEVVDRLLPAAGAAELLHNYATVTDDIVDRDRVRRGKLSLHAKFGMLAAQMTGAYLCFAAHQLVADDPRALRIFTELGKRIAAVECRQWRLRRQVLGVDTWLEIAGEDTGRMFEACARIGTGDDRLARYGYLLGTIYHGCDDIADIRGTLALGAHSERDITDRILTLPAAIAMRDGTVAQLFAEAGPDRDQELASRLEKALPAAEEMLDGLMAEAELEARREARNADSLIDLLRYTRELSSS